MDLTEEIIALVGQPESETLEYKAVLPPSKNIAQLIGSFANTNGGYIILGILDNYEVNGLSEDFHANTITHKALDLLNPQPKVYYQYIAYDGKKLYAIKVEKSSENILLEGKLFRRAGTSSVLTNPVEITFKQNGYNQIKVINQKLESKKDNATYSLFKFLDHYQSILKIFDDLSVILYPLDAEQATTHQEGKVLTRILFSSFVDNFETYLSDLLYEIYLAKPDTLKSIQTVTIEEVLNCSDMQEFIRYWSKQKLSKLQKGSVKGFIKDNKQISELNIINKENQEEIEKTLQIRHLYSHRNGVVDEKFLQFFTGQFILNSIHQMSAAEICKKLDYLSNIAATLDKAAITKYNLAKNN